MSFGLHAKAIVLVTLLGLVSACGQGTVDSDRDPVYFSPLEDQELEPRVHQDPGPPMSSNEKQQIQPVLEGFRTNARRVLAKPDIGERISQIESIFIASGYIFELAGIYQDLVEQEGISSPAATRLAWILLQMGQEKQARMWIDRLLVTYPGRASSWYLDAIFHLPKLRDGGSAPARIVYSWNRAQSDQTTRLTGFGERQMQMVDQQVARLEEQIPQPALDAVEQELAELLATPVIELPAPPALATPEDQAPSDTESTDSAPTDAPADAPTAGASERPASDIQRPTPQPGRATEKEEPIKITVARGTIALSNGEPDKAMRIYQSALRRDPDNIQAKLGMARAGWTDENMRNQSSSTIRALAARDDLTPRQKYEIGLFVFSKMDDNALAIELWTQVADDDPKLAKRVGLDEMLEKARR